MNASYTELTPQFELEVESVTPCADLVLEQDEQSYEMEVENAREIYIGGTQSHDSLKNRDLPDQHPIAAITGLEKSLEHKVEKESGMGLSSNDYPLILQELPPPLLCCRVCHSILLLLFGPDNTHCLPLSWLHVPFLFPRLSARINA